MRTCQEPMIVTVDGEYDLFVCTLAAGHRGPHIDADAEWTWRNWMDVERLIKGHEGLALQTYHDTEGHPIIGWGHRCGAGQPDTVITYAEAEKLFRADFDRARRIADEWLGAVKLDDPRYAVIADMAFDLGDRIRRCTKLLTALRAGDWDGASAAMLHPTWVRQEGMRALRNAAIMAQGEWIPDGAADTRLPHVGGGDDV